MNATVRKYQEKDKERLRYICRETAGDDFKKNKNTLNAVPVIYSDYFTEIEPENIFVAADADDNAVGYILCSTDREKFRRIMMKKYMKKAVSVGRGILPCCIGYSMAWLMSGKEQSCHLHIDILPEYQHGGLGSKLIDTLRDHLKEKGFAELYVNTIDVNAPAYGFYMKYGFHRTRRFTKTIYGLAISTDRSKKE